LDDVLRNRLPTLSTIAGPHNVANRSSSHNVAYQGICMSASRCDSF